MSNKEGLNILKNNYEGGLNMDNHDDVQHPNTYPFALNIVPRDHTQNTYKSNEHSNVKLFDFPEPFAGFVHDLRNNRTYYLLKNQELWYQNHETEELVYITSPSEFNCSWEIADCEFINMEVYSKSCDTYLQFSANNIYYIVNISEHLDPKRKENLIEKLTSEDCRSCQSSCEYFKVFKSKCSSSMKVSPEQKGGGLRAGTYFYSFRLVNVDGSYTTWSEPTDPAYIYSEHNTNSEEGKGRNRLLFQNLNCDFDKIEIAFIYKSHYNVIVKIIDPMFFSSRNFTYDHVETDLGNAYTLFDITAPSSVNLSGKYQTLFNNKMHYWGIKPNKEYNVQKIANNIGVKFYTEKYSLDLAKKHQVKSLPRGETLAFGIWVNHDDQTRSEAGILICKGGGNGTDRGTEYDMPYEPNGEIEVIQNPETIRHRGALEASVSDPLADDQLLEIEAQLIESYNTDIEDIAESIGPAIDVSSKLPNNSPSTRSDEDEGGVVDDGSLIDTGECCDGDDAQFAMSRKQQRDENLVRKDLKTAETIAVKWGSILSTLIGKEGKKDLVKTFSPSNIKELALDIIEAVRNRETIILKEGKYKVSSKNHVRYDNESTNSTLDLRADSFNEEVDSISNHTTALVSAPERDTLGLNKGVLQEEDSLDFKRSEYPGGEFLKYYSPICSPEKDTRYHCGKDCDGKYIFGRYANTPVTNFKVPDETVIPYYESKSVGVPSKVTPDADEYDDGYVIVIGAEFNNIHIDFDEYYKTTGKKVCKNNPYTIGQVKLNDYNKTILTKGLVTGGFVSQNDGKEYIYQNLGVNSFEKCDRYIDIDGSRMDPEAPEADSVFMYSLDQSAIEPYVSHATTLEYKKKLSGIGYRHGLYVQGKDPVNKLNGRQIDIKGAYQSVNLSNQKTLAHNYPDINITGCKYVNSNTVASPISKTTLPLMNKHQQSCLWISGANVRGLKDRSFVGDGLDHEVPITHAESYYGVLTRKLDNQYGNIESLSFVPKLQGRYKKVRGLIGDRFIAPYSFVKTSFVSNKVGDKFFIGNMNPGKSDRCICDSPEDSGKNMMGGWFWTYLPKSGDSADAKNWCNLHTGLLPPIGAQKTRTFEDTLDIWKTESDMYYPGTVTTLITYWGEWETNPYGVEISDKLEEQRYNFIRTPYKLGANISGNDDWQDSFLNQFHIKVKQPSLAEKLIKKLLKSLLGLAPIILGIEDLLDPESVQEVIGDITNIPMMLATWLLLNKVFFTDEFVDEFVGIEVCKTQTEGGIQFNVKGFFNNWNNYSTTYNAVNDFIQVPLLREISIRRNCCENSTSNTIYQSDQLIIDSIGNGLVHVKPNNYYTFGNDKGKLTDLFVVDNSFYAHTEHAIYNLEIPRLEVPTNSYNLLMGQGNILQPQIIAGSNLEGYGGLYHKSHAYNSAAGRIFIDYKAGVLYKFSRNQLKPISHNGVHNFFKYYSQFCNVKEDPCFDDQTGDYGYSIGFDPSLQRVLITKRNLDSSWTISWDITGNRGEGAFISFHNYYPYKYLATRDKLYHLTKDSLYIHDHKYVVDNQLELNIPIYNNFFEEDYPTILDTKTVSPDKRGLEDEFYYSSHIINIESRELTPNGIIYDKNLLPNKIGFLNDKQTSGIMNLIPSTVIENNTIDRLKDRVDNIEAVKQSHTWRINEFANYIINDQEALLKYVNTCLPFVEFSNYSYTMDKSFQNNMNRRLSSNWFLTRLIWELIEAHKNQKVYFKSTALLVESKNE